MNFTDTELMNKMNILTLIAFIPLSLMAEDLKIDQHIIQLKSSKIANDFLKKIDTKKIEVAARGDSFIVIRPKSYQQHHFYSNFIKSLSKSNDIEFIKEDKIIHPNNKTTEDPALCEVKAESDGIFGLAKFFNKQPSCQLDQHCHGKNPNWAKYLIDADLAEKEVQELIKVKGDQNIATVAVVDSGFNYMDNAKNLSAKNVRVAKGFYKAGDEAKDEGGHGTAVSGMISAKGVGVTSSINLNIYRTTEGGANGSTSHGFLSASIEKACHESDIVNVSWGSDMEELGYGDIEKELWYKNAQKMGCLIIKSSGNAGIKKKVIEKKVPEDAPVLFVGAINNQGQEASFSSVGDIKAPGEGVFTLVSNDETDRDEYQKKRECIIDGVKYGPINGTSFSSPATAAVAGQIVTVLKLNNSLPKDPIQKIKLIKNILVASTISNGQNLVNAFRAVKLARMVNSSDSLKSPKELSDQLDQEKSPLCGPSEDCRTLMDCQDKKSCFYKLRSNITLCKLKDDRQQLISLLSEMKEYDLLAGYLPLLEKGDLSNDKTDQILLTLWENNVSGKGVDNIQTAFALMKLAKKLGRDEFINIEKFNQVFKSSEFWWKFNVRSDIGENVWNQQNEQFFPEMIELFGYLPIKDQKKLIDMNEKMDPVLGVKTESLSFLLIAEKNSDKLPKEVSLYLKSTIDKLSDKFLNGDMINKVSSYNLEQSPVLDLLVKHNPQGKEIIKNKLNGTLNKPEIKFMAYSLGSKQIFTHDEKIEVSRDILKKSETNPQDLKYATEQAIKVLMDSDNESDAELLKKTLLTDPYPSAGSEFHKLWSIDKRAKKKLLADPLFWNDYLSFSLDNSKKFVKGELPTRLTETGSAIKTLSVLIQTNAIGEDDKIEILKKNKIKIQNVLNEAMNVSQSDFFGLSLKGYESRDAINTFSENYSWLKEKNIFSEQDIKELSAFVQKRKNVYFSANRYLGH